MRCSMLQYRDACCSGYSGSPSTNCQRKSNRVYYSGYSCCAPIAICSQSCANGGTCDAPDTCNCLAGWTGQYCTNG